MSANTEAQGSGRGLGSDEVDYRCRAADRGDRGQLPLS